MIKIGLREANIHFTKYIKMVRQGKEVIVTDRGTPIASIRPVLQEKASPEERILEMEKQGILKRPVKKAFFFHKLIHVPGKSISGAVMEERDER
jgi:prevent-host-death family protein